MVALLAWLLGAPQSPRQQRCSIVMESGCTFDQRSPISSLIRSPVYTETNTIVEYGSGINVSRAENFSGGTYGLVLRPRVSRGRRMPSAGFVTSRPYSLAEPSTLESTSRILSFDSCDNSESAMPEKNFCRVRGVSSRRHILPNAGLNGSMESAPGSVSPYYQEARRLLEPQRDRVTLQWIPREENFVCDELSKSALRSMGVVFRLPPDETPQQEDSEDFLERIVRDDMLGQGWTI